MTYNASFTDVLVSNFILKFHMRVCLFAESDPGHPGHCSADLLHRDGHHLVSTHLVTVIRS